MAALSSLVARVATRNVVVEVVVTAQLIYKDRVATALKVDIFCRVVFPLVLLAIAAYSFLL